MKRFLFLLMFSITGTINAQGECQMVYISDHYVLNNTEDTVMIWVNNRDQENFATKGPTKYNIAPNARVKIAELAWAEEFRDPTGWYVFKVASKGLTRLCDKKNWIFEELSETKGEYSLKLEPSSELPCKPLNDDLYFTD